MDRKKNCPIQCNLIEGGSNALEHFPVVNIRGPVQGQKYIGFLFALHFVNRITLHVFTPEQFELMEQVIDHDVPDEMDPLCRLPFTKQIFCPALFSNEEI